VEPDPCHSPFALDGGRRYRERVGRLRDVEPGEESQFHDTALLTSNEDNASRAWSSASTSTLDVDVGAAAPAALSKPITGGAPATLASPLATCVVDEDAHQPGRSRKEVRAAFHRRCARVGRQTLARDGKAPGLALLILEPCQGSRFPGMPVPSTDYTTDKHRGPVEVTFTKWRTAVLPPSPEIPTRFLFKGIVRGDLGEGHLVAEVLDRKVSTRWSALASALIQGGTNGVTGAALLDGVVGAEAPPGMCFQGVIRVWAGS
jgi:hypothetical protein